MKFLTALIPVLVLACTSTGAGRQAAAPADIDFAVYTSDAAGFHATSTLILGPEEAVLVDAQFNLTNGRALASWLKGRLGERTLKAIYITHAHPDHFFGVEEVLKEFPGTPVVALPAVVAHVRALAPKKLEQWKPMYGDDLTDAPIVPEVLTAPLTVDGQVLATLEVSADTEPMSIIHVPSAELVVASDLAYAGVHVWLAEAPEEAQRQAWLDSLDTVSALSPRSVVAGHKTPEAENAATSLDGTAAYIRTFNELAAGSPSADALKAEMLERYPNLALPIILELATQAVH